MKISVRNFKEGMILEDNVYSKLGGMVFKKGTRLKDKDREIMKAFGIEFVKVEKNAIEKNIITTTIEENKTEDNGFMKLFNHSLKEIDHILSISSHQIPIVDLRKAIKPLLNDDYMQFSFLSNLHYTYNHPFNYDSHHALSVGVISYAIATWMNLKQSEKMQIALAGVLHDIGMRKFQNTSIYTKSKLSYNEFNEIKKHPYYSYQLLKNTKGISEGTLLAVLQHHERLDGSGYPLQLKEEKIHFFAKIVAIADTFHAMISERIYRDAFPIYNALEKMMDDSLGKLDPIMVTTFTTKMTNFVSGLKVILNNGNEGIIVFVDQKNPTRPWVKVDGNIINLTKDKDLFIKSII